MFWNARESLSLVFCVHLPFLDINRYHCLTFTLLVITLYRGGKKTLLMLVTFLASSCRVTGTHKSQIWAASKRKDIQWWFWNRHLFWMNIMFATSGRVWDAEKHPGIFWCFGFRHKNSDTDCAYCPSELLFVLAICHLSCRHSYPVSAIVVVSFKMFEEACCSVFFLFNCSWRSFPLQCALMCVQQRPFLICALNCPFCL